jgi:hypothetical protein
VLAGGVFAIEIGRRHTMILPLSFPLLSPRRLPPH